MGKIGRERPHVVATRLSDEEKEWLDEVRGSVDRSAYVRWLIQHAERPKQGDV